MHIFGYVIRPSVGRTGAVFLFFFMISLKKRNIMEVKENPYKIPEKNRFLLFDLYEVRYCNDPSIISGIIKILIMYLQV